MADQEVKWTLAVDDSEATPKVIKLGKAMQKELVVVSEATAKHFIKVSKASEKMQDGLVATQAQVNSLTMQNKQLTASLEDLQETTVFEKIAEGVKSAGKAAAASAIAFAGVAAIDKLFIPLNASIGKVNDTILKTSFFADKAFSEFAAGEGRIKSLQSSFLRFTQRGLEATSVGLNQLKANLGKTRVILKGFQSSLQAGAKITSMTASTFVAAAKHTELFEKGLAGAITRAGVGATAFAALGSSLIRSNNIFEKMAGVTLIAFAVALGGIVVVANQVLNAVGNLAIAIGDTLTEASERQIKAFSKAEETTFAFNQTIAAYSKNSEAAAAATTDWTNFQKEQSEATGVQAATMRAMIAETISATEAAHLSVDAQKDLIKASIDLSERAHKPQMETLIALINAMNGNGQAVIALGLHVNDAAVKHSKLTQAQKDNFKSASDAEKAQTRLAVIMEQAGKAAGFATMNADLYSKAIKLQKNAQETLNAELGRGAAIINGEYRLGLATATNALTNFFKPILPGVGFLQALGGRVLQVTGFLTKNLLTVTLLTSSYKALNILLARGFAGGAFGKSLPIINKSLGKMAKDLGATTTRFDSMKNVAKASLEIVTKQSLNGVKALLGLDAAAKLTAGTVGKQMVKGFMNVAKAIGTATKASLAFVASPMGLTIVGITAAVFLLFKAFQKLEQETRIFSEVWNDLVESFAGSSAVFEPVLAVLKQIGIVLARVIGVQVKLVAAGLSLMVSSVFRVILAFQKLSKFLPESMRASDEAIAKTEDRINKLDAATKKFAVGALKDMGNLFMAQASAAEASTMINKQWRKELEASTAAVNKFGEKAKKAFEFAQDFTPNLNLKKFKAEAAKFEGTLIEFQGALEDKKLTLLNAPEQTEEIKKALDATVAKIADAEEAIQGIRMKRAQEIRNTRLAIASNELEMQRQKVFSVEQEIKQMKIDLAEEIRDFRLENLTQSLLEQRGIITADQREGITLRQQALLEANAIELEAFKNKLNAEKELALTMEQQKQLELANLRSSLLQGTSQGAQAGEDAAVLQEQQKLAQLNTLRQQDLISEQQYQMDRMAVIQAGKQRTFEMEMQMEQQRISALGLSPEALQAKLDMQAEQDAMEMERLRTMLANKQLTQDEFRIAGEQLELNSQMRAKQTRQQFLQAEIQQNRMRGESFKATLKEIELAQQQHGQVMGTLRAVQGSAEFGAINGMLSNLSSLRNSESKKEFEIGKKAAIAQTLVNTFMSATMAFSSLAGIPIVGPVLGAAAAAAAVAAGMMNVRQIKKQKFSGGSASGSQDAPTAQVPSHTLGGQAHQGMDAVPQSMHNKSFIVAGGERIVQSEANKDLTKFLDDQKEGGAGSGNTFNFHIGAVDSNERVQQLAQAVKDVIRSDSERGEPIINAKGIVNG